MGGITKFLYDLFKYYLMTLFTFGINDYLVEVDLNLAYLIKRVKELKKINDVLEIKGIRTSIQVADRQIISYLWGRLHKQDKKDWNKLKKLLGLR